MAVHDLLVDSGNGRDQLRAWLHTPVVGTCRGLVQLAHGFGEHARRYLPLVNALTEAGYAVAMDDHAGHGATAAANDTWGSSGSASYGVFVEDEHRLRERAQALVPDVPYLLFGHSWGSMIAREYLTTHGAGVAGAVFCGTTGMTLGMHEVRQRAAEVMRASGSEAPDGGAIGLVLAPMTRRWGADAHPLEWISDDPAVLADYTADPFNLGARPVTAGFSAGFGELYERIDAPQWAARVPHDTAVLFVAGDADPVGGFGSGVYQVANRLQDAGHPDVTTRLWSGVRHEVHNQPQVRAEVFGAVVDFYDRVVDALG